MAIKSDKIGQSWLLPPDIRDLIPVDHICYLVVAIVNSIDMSEVEKKYRFTPGNPAYSRRMLLRLVIIKPLERGISYFLPIFRTLLYILQTFKREGN